MVFIIQYMCVPLSTLFINTTTGDVLYGVSIVSSSLLPIFLAQRMYVILERSNLINCSHRRLIQHLLVLPMILICASPGMLKELSLSIVVITAPKVIISLMIYYLGTLAILNICEYVDKKGYGNCLGLCLVLETIRGTFVFVMSVLGGVMSGSLSGMGIVGLGLLAMLIVSSLTFFLAHHGTDIFDYRLGK